MSGIGYAFPSIDSAVASQFAAAGSLDIAPLRTAVTQQVNANFIQAINTSEGTANNAQTYGTLLSRNQSITDIANDMIKMNESSKIGKDTYVRQGEINEWQAQNKLDTLFFLQASFLYFTLVVVTIFLRQYGILPTSTMWTINVLFGIILIGILWNRASYTYNSRDKRYWNRRYIGLADSGLSAKAMCSNA
jgi:hypothetical protein